MPRRIMPITLISFLLALALAALPASPARADAPSFTVNTTADRAIGVAANCAAGNAGTCTLRDAIAAANATSGATITFAVFAPITLSSPLGVSSAMTIQGRGVAVTGIAAGSPSNHVFDVTASGPVAFSGVTIALGSDGIWITGTGGVTVTACSLAFNTVAAIGVDAGSTLTVSASSLSANRHAIVNGAGGTVSVSDSTFAQNASTSGIFGGGIVNTGRLTVTNSTFSQNSSAGNGAAIYNWTGSATVANSTFVGNSASFFGGGIWNADTGALTVTNSTFSGNTAPYGGGIYNDGYLTLINDTLAGNSASAAGGGISNRNSGVARATNTLIVDSTSGGDLDFAIQGGGHNLTGTFAFADPDATQPQDHGGPTRTLALPPGSPAIDAGDDGACTATGPSAVNGVDQRGVSRAGRGAHCDIGAFESRGFTLTASGGTPQSARVAAPFATPLAVTVGSTSGEPVLNGTVTFTANSVGDASAVLAGSPATVNGSGVASVTATANETGGTYTVTASVPGSSTASASFALANLPAANAITPASGSSAGGSAVTITGVGFAPGATVTFGGVAATNVMVVNGIMITASTPAHAAGAVDVAVTVSGATGTLPDGYAYANVAPLPPTAPSVAPQGSPAPKPNTRAASTPQGIPAPKPDARP